MPAPESILSPANRRIATLALCVLVCDQITKWFVLRCLLPGDERPIIPGFFNLTYRVNTGAAWSMFTGNNAVLASVALAALVVLYLTRHHFSAHRLLGQFAFGLIFGGILGNLTDRLLPGPPRGRGFSAFLHGAARHRRTSLIFRPSMWPTPPFARAWR